MWEILSAILQSLLVSTVQAGVQMGAQELSRPSAPSRQGPAAGGSGQPQAPTGGSPTRPSAVTSGFAGLPPLNVSGNVTPGTETGFQGLANQSKGGFQLPNRGGGI